ncbi:facilitated trehalose transporter Tret1 isoform X1 [Maniola hyperantus]|uniref:facilitated trehalose transporter Tret1 isoform X1 n=1 Tax=Aphantopus hyperantus TaxID=2795564 RepID=UPI001568B3AA|nr:facilitated trehalose transporter Tret1 isoform X1 [Maniola hyperantus]XP_034837427.1 facilitated trehalose transporter Tret1 isoform X1 [Maniola hyperantus]
MAERSYAYEMVATGTGAVDDQPYRQESGQLWRQYLIGAVANIAILCTGYSMGWTAPVNIKLTSNDTSQSPLDQKATSDEIAWMGSVLNIGAIIGPFIGGFAASSIGRKWGLMSSAIPLFVGWILVAAATNMAFLYAGRIFWGIAVGMLFTISPMYCAEIATVESRGALGSFLQSFITVGFLLVYGAGPFISYHAVAYLGVAVVALFAVSFFFMPESPTYYLLKDRNEDAAQCLMTLRGRSRQGVAAELALLKVDVTASMQKTATIKDVFHGSNFKAFYISCALVFFQQFSGINAVLFYMTDIFKASGTDLDPSIATIIIGAVQLVASFITPFVVDRLGRRILLLVSSCGTAIGSTLLGMFFLLSYTGNPVAEKISFLPILALVLFIVTYCWGLGPLPWAVMGELFPIEVKAAAAPIATAFCWILSFLVTKFFPSISESIGMHVGFFIFGACCVAAFFFTLFVVPETKGKSFQEIQAMLGAENPEPEKA